MKFDESGNSGESVNSCTDIPLDGCDESGDPWISDTEFQDDAAYDRQIAEKSVNRMREQHVNVCTVVFMP